MNTYATIILALLLCSSISFANSGRVVTTTEDVSITDKLGLKDGDVVQTVNKKKVKNNLDAMMALSKLQHEKHIEIEVLRAGKLQKLVYDVK